MRLYPVRLHASHRLLPSGQRASPHIKLGGSSSRFVSIKCRGDRRHLPFVFRSKIEELASTPWINTVKGIVCDPHDHGWDKNGWRRGHSAVVVASALELLPAGCRSRVLAPRSDIFLAPLFQIRATHFAHLAVPQWGSLNTFKVGLRLHGVIRSIGRSFPRVDVERIFILNRLIITQLIT